MDYFDISGPEQLQPWAQPFFMWLQPSISYDGFNAWYEMNLEAWEIGQLLGGN